MRRYFEDFSVSERFVTASRTIGEVQIAQWSALSGDFNELHTSETFAKASPFGRRIAQGGVGMAVAMGMQNSIWEEGGRASLSYSCEYLHPIFLGDTVHCVVEVLERSQVPPGKGGIIRVGVELIDQDGKVLQRGEQRLLFYPRPEAAP